MTRIINNGKSIQFNGKTISLPPKFDDWFLPVQAGLSRMFTELNNHSIGDFSNGYYWASRESTSTLATVSAFSSGAAISKSGVCHVRPARSFTAPEGTYSLRDVGPAGGWIYLIIGTLYYEAHKQDLEDSVYSNITNALCGADSSSEEDSMVNTLAIINQVGHTNSAAKLCNDLVVYGKL